MTGPGSRRAFLAALSGLMPVAGLAHATATQLVAPHASGKQVIATLTLMHAKAIRDGAKPLKFWLGRKSFIASRRLNRSASWFDLNNIELFRGWGVVHSRDDRLSPWGAVLVGDMTQETPFTFYRHRVHDVRSYRTAHITEYSVRRAA